jgi:hypothetical protein
MWTIIRDDDLHLLYLEDGDEHVAMIINLSEADEERARLIAACPEMINLLKQIMHEGYSISKAKEIEKLIKSL